MEYAKICKICGKEFTTKLKNEITCSPDCSYKNKMLINRKYQEKQREKRRTEKKPTISICQCCNSPFIRTSKNREKMYCSKLCEKLAKLQQEKKMEKPKPKKTKKFKDNLSKDVYECEQLNKERKERGERALSYGYYKAYQKQGVIK